MNVGPRVKEKTEEGSGKVEKRVLYYPSGSFTPKDQTFPQFVDSHLNNNPALRGDVEQLKYALGKLMTFTGHLLGLLYDEGIIDEEKMCVILGSHQTAEEMSLQIYEK